MKCLITGSCGFVFSNFIRKAIYSKWPLDLVSIDKVVDPSTLHNIYANKSHKFYLGDVCDDHLIDLIFSIEKPDLVIHGAETQDQTCLTNNLHSTQVLLDACLKHHVNKFIYISSDEIYSSVPIDSEVSWNEESQPNPENIYGISKFSAEMLTRVYATQHHLNYNILRLCNCLGPRQSCDQLIPGIVKNILTDETIILKDRGCRVRDWLSVDDACQAIFDVALKGESNQIYNISATYEFSDLEIFHEITKVLGKGFNLLHLDPGFPTKKSSTSNKLKNLGWTPSFKIKKAIEYSVNWMVNNKWFLKI